MHGRARVANQGWWALAVGVGVVVSALKDAWERKFPYCMVLGLPNLISWFSAWLAKLFTTADTIIGWCQRAALGVLAKPAASWWAWAGQCTGPTASHMPGHFVTVTECRGISILLTWGHYK
jgi:hypothetical protein